MFRIGLPDEISGEGIEASGEGILANESDKILPLVGFYHLLTRVVQKGCMVAVPPLRLRDS